MACATYAVFKKAYSLFSDVKAEIQSPSVSLRSMHLSQSGGTSKTKLEIVSFPDQKLASGHLGDSWTIKPAKRDNRVSPLISPLGHADKASAGSPIG